MKRTSLLLGAAFLALAFAAPANAEPCQSDDVVGSAASVDNLSAAGHPLITIEAVGDVTIRGRGSFATVCDPESARVIRNQLQARFDGADGGTSVEVAEDEGSAHLTYSESLGWLLERGSSD